MSGHNRIWCPNGCGLSVTGFCGNMVGDKRYLCSRCKKRFSREELLACVRLRNSKPSERTD